MRFNDRSTRFRLFARRTTASSGGDWLQLILRWFQRSIVERPDLHAGDRRFSKVKSVERGYRGGLTLLPFLLCKINKVRFLLHAHFSVLGVNPIPGANSTLRDI